MIDWSEMKPLRKPTKKEKARYQRWVKYLTHSKLNLDEVHSRAAKFTEAGKEPTYD